MGDYTSHLVSQPLAGKTVPIRKEAMHFQYPDFGESDYRLEDWWDLLTGSTWKDAAAKGNFAAVIYSKRVVENSLPDANEGVYGKTGYLGSLVHATELDHDRGPSAMANRDLQEENSKLIESSSNKS